MTETDDMKAFRGLEDIRVMPATDKLHKQLSLFPLLQKTPDTPRISFKTELDDKVPVTEKAWLVIKHLEAHQRRKVPS